MPAEVAQVQGLDEYSPYHFGEVTVQTQAGVRDVSAKNGNLIRNYINNQHKAFFQELSHLHVATRNADGSVWATTLCGEPGFLQVIDETHLSIRLNKIYGDPAKFCQGSGLGSVGLMLHNRRRNKLNCTIESVQPRSLVLRVVQALGNCPKYISIRHLVVDKNQVEDLEARPQPVSQGGSSLGNKEKAFIARSDTFFLATSFGGGQDGPSSCDCNHRGGMPGFVQVSGEGTLLIPDYIGNNMFQSLGNIAAYPHAGIQFLDYANGDSLQLTGKAEILYDERTLPGAQRTIKFVTTRWVHVKGALPIATEGSVEPSPYSPLPEGEQNKASMGLKCLSKWQETHNITTFAFTAPKPANDKNFCEAGQFASFDFPQFPGDTLNRTWTISSTPQQIASAGRFTISVKRAGLVSSWLHDKLTVGQEVVFRGVDGDFTLDKAAKCIPPAGVLLIAGGIGVTPVRVMFAECLHRGYPVTVLYTFRGEKDAAFLNEFKQGAVSRENVRLAVALTGGLPDDSLPEVETFQGRLSADIIKKVCPDCAQREVFQCGPTPMMNAAISALESLGVSSTQIHQESFGF